MPRARWKKSTLFISQNIASDVLDRFFLTSRSVWMIYVLLTTVLAESSSDFPITSYRKIASLIMFSFLLPCGSWVLMLWMNCVPWPWGVAGLWEWSITLKGHMSQPKGIRLEFNSVSATSDTDSGPGTPLPFAQSMPSKYAFLPRMTTRMQFPVTINFIIE